MGKLIASLGLAGLLVWFLVMKTPVARLGSGFLIGDTKSVLTYYDLVKDSESISVKFPNEDDIKARLVYKNPQKNMALLELEEMPLVKRDPLLFSGSGDFKRGAPVFTLGYPWTNTLEDRHTLIEGALADRGVQFEDLIPIELEDLDPVHSGSPLIDHNNQVAGMVLWSGHAPHRPADSSTQTHFAIPTSTLIEALKAMKLPDSPPPVKPQARVSREAFVEAVRNNIVLIEAR